MHPKQLPNPYDIFDCLDPNAYAAEHVDLDILNAHGLHAAQLAQAIDDARAVCISQIERWARLEGEFPPIADDAPFSPDELATIERLKIERAENEAVELAAITRIHRKEMTRSQSGKGFGQKRKTKRKRTHKSIEHAAPVPLQTQQSNKISYRLMDAIWEQKMYAALDEFSLP